MYGYTLKWGHSWDSKIPEFPKTGKKLEKALNDSAYILGHHGDSYALLTKEEYDRMYIYGTRAEE